MAAFSKFTDIIAWQKARILTREIYLVTNRGDFRKDFGLRDQIRKSSVSIMANIAEGFGRRGDKEFKRFLEISLGSAYETQSHLFIALDIEYLKKEEFDLLFEMLEKIAKMIISLADYLKKS